MCTEVSTEAFFGTLLLRRNRALINDVWDVRSKLLESYDIYVEMDRTSVNYAIHLSPPMYSIENGYLVRVTSGDTEGLFTEEYIKDRYLSQLPPFVVSALLAESESIAV